jgi:hypothetical protein
MRPAIFFPGKTRPGVWFVVVGEEGKGQWEGTKSQRLGRDWFEVDDVII